MLKVFEGIFPNKNHLWGYSHGNSQIHRPRWSCWSRWNSHPPAPRTRWRPLHRQGRRTKRETSPATRYAGDIIKVTGPKRWIYHTFTIYDVICTNTCLESNPLSVQFQDQLVLSCTKIYKIYDNLQYKFHSTNMGTFHQQRRSSQWRQNIA